MVRLLTSSSVLTPHALVFNAFLTLCLQLGKLRGKFSLFKGQRGLFAKLKEYGVHSKAKREV